MEGSVQGGIYRYDGSELERREDWLAVEKPLVISLGGKEAIRLYCTPLMIRELVVGFLMGEGIVEGAACFERMSVEYSDNEVRVDVPHEGEVRLEGGARTSGCAGGVTFGPRPAASVSEGMRIDAGVLLGLYGEFHSMPGLYKETGCVHSAALSINGVMECFTEDIGRHNAVDKVIGYCLLEDLPLDESVMMVSGRLTSEMVSKCARWGMQMLVSRSAPSSLAVEIAVSVGMTLVGFVRGRRFNVYSRPDRIVTSP